MSIRFICHRCGQRLSVTPQRAGQAATCPKCKSTLQIPADSTREAGTKNPVTAAGASTGPIPQVTSPAPLPVPPANTISTLPARGAVDPVAAPFLTSPSAPASPQETPVEEERETGDMVLVPRYVIFSQGFLLIATGVLAFLLGFAARGITTPTPGKPTAAPATEGVPIKGTVSLRQRGMRADDVGALLLFIPWDAKPAIRIKLEPIIESGDAAARAPFEEGLQKLGGRIVRANERGQYEVSLPAAGRFGLLVLSGTAQERDDGSPPLPDDENLERLFDLGSDPLGRRRYQWRPETIRGPATINIDFD